MENKEFILAIIAIGLAVSEMLALIPGSKLKSNSVLTLIGNLLKGAYNLLGGKKREGQ